MRYVTDCGDHRTGPNRLPLAKHHSVPCHLVHASLEPHLDTSAFKLSLREPGQVLVELSQNPFPCMDEDGTIPHRLHRRIKRGHILDEIVDCGRSFDAAKAAADRDEGQELTSSDFILRNL